jgi:hypothetical protein
MMNAAELRDYIRGHFTRTAYRWERLPAYQVSHELIA